MIVFVVTKLYRTWFLWPCAHFKGKTLRMPFCGQYQIKMANHLQPMIEAPSTVIIAHTHSSSSNSSWIIEVSPARTTMILIVLLLITCIEPSPIVISLS